MKNSSMLLIAVFGLASFAHADELVCPPPALPACSHNGADISKDPAAIVAAISAQEFCFQAVKLAENCGSGVGGDISFVNAAAAKCEAKLTEARPSQSDLGTLATMRSSCQKKWFGREGSQYISLNGYCKLRALSWILNLNNEQE